MEYPDYTFDKKPDAMQMRQMAVQAMRDILSIQWSPKNNIRYRKNGPGNKREFVHEARHTYAGLPYSSASSGLFQFLEYYNSETGCLEYDGTSDAFNLELGSTCADTLLWAWSTVANSFTGGYYPILMVPSNGYKVVGKYTYRDTITSYHEMPSYAIIKNNPKEVILDAYASALPADALISTSSNHAMMVIEAPVVTILPDGTIDSANSYLMIQDQQAGGSIAHREMVDGIEVPYRGRICVKYTFDKLYEDNYIPVTIAEFTGDKDYEYAYVNVNDPQCANINTLTQITVTSNYPLAVINLISTDSDGKENVVLREMFSGSSMHGVPHSYALSEMDGLDLVSIEPGSVLKLEVVVSTGERFCPIEFTA